MMTMIQVIGMQGITGLNNGDYFFNPDVQAQDIYQVVELEIDSEGSIQSVIVDHVGYHTNMNVTMYRTPHRTTYNWCADVTQIKLNTTE